jgi:hypothetical protein
MKLGMSLRVFGNKVPRGMFGPEGGEVTGVWRKLLNEELLPYQTKDEVGSACTKHGIKLFIIKGRNCLESKHG